LLSSFWFCCNENGNGSKLLSPSCFGFVAMKKVTVVVVTFFFLVLLQ
jgi:hypothetical protein